MDRDQEFAEALAVLRQEDPEMRRRKKHRLPPDRYCLSDCEYFFTLCARHLAEPFREPQLARAIVDALLYRRELNGWILYCYCLMPDHLHFIVRLRPHQIRIVNAGARGHVPEGILDHVARFKRYTTTQIWWKMGGERALWQRSSYDRIIRDRGQSDTAVRYVLNNPVRKGLAADWRDYPYAGLVDWPYPPDA